jgi:citrate synthase
MEKTMTVTDAKSGTAYEVPKEMIMPDHLHIIDSRTGKEYPIPITNGTIKAMDLRQIKVADDDFGLMAYDPAFMNTAACKSTITLIDGDRGILRYRGYPIEQIAEKCNFLEVAYLTINGDLPTKAQLQEWTFNITHHTMLHENIKRFMEGFHHDAHPMGMLVSTIGALSTFYPDSRKIHDPEVRLLQTYRLLGKIPTIAAYCYRHRMGLPYVYPDNDLSYAGNFLNMMYKMTELKYTPNPILERALDIYGPLHGGANEQVLRMLNEIGSADKVGEFIKRVKAGEGRLMGFGHRIYKNYDPRAKIIKETAEKVFEVTGRNPLLDIAIALEKVALEDEYFVKRKLYPNVDFYSGIIYQAMGFPTDAFTVLFAIGRTAGWIAQWQEMLQDPEQKIARPRQVYLGSDKRDVVPIERRK